MSETTEAPMMQRAREQIAEILASDVSQEQMTEVLLRTVIAPILSAHDAAVRTGHYLEQALARCDKRLTAAEADWNDLRGRR